MKVCTSSGNLFRNSRWLILFLFASLMTLRGAFASHMAGADITYQHLGNGQYLVTYTFYRDCFGIDAPTQVTLNYSSLACNVSSSETLLPIPGTGQQITYVCPGTLTTCDGGNEPGIQEWVYTGIVQLTPCPDWTFGVSDCCRNAAITTLFDPSNDNMYVEANLNNSLFENNSPIFSNDPIAFECIGQNNYYNHGGFDADGDSLVYAFYNPLNGPNDPVAYNPGYSVSNPITSVPAVSIDPFSGDIFMHPTTPEVGVIGVLILEYRNGVLIGAVMRDIQIYTIQCSNNLPVASGINGTNSFNYTTCTGGQFCFDIFSSDLDASDSLIVTWNQGIPAATFTITPGQTPIGHFCWTTDSNDVSTQPYYFTVTVRDNACPSNGVQTFAYSILVSNPSVSLNTTNISCHGDHNGSASVTNLNGLPLQYFWMPGEQTTPSISHLVAGNYTLDVTDSAGCSGTYVFTITEPPALTVNVTGQNASCSGAQGSATAMVSGGTGAYHYSWNTNPVQTTQTATGLNAGTYTVIVTDDNQCDVTGTVTLTGSAPFTINLNSTPATCLANDGTASVSVTGSNGPFTYTWQPNVSSTANASNLAAGSYSVTVTDNVTGCMQTGTVIVNNSSGITATVVSQMDETCQFAEDGSATISASGGTGPYTYLWSPGGDTTSTVSDLTAGNYIVTVFDYNGCPATLNLTIGFQHPAPVINLGPDTVLCIGTSLVLDAGSGYASYLWSDNSTMQTLTVTTGGTYTVFVTDSNGCQNFDPIDVTFVICPVNNPSVVMPPVNMVSIYPNPAHEKVELVLNTSLKESSVHVEVLNAAGEKLDIFDDALKYSYSRTIDISKYPAGIYYIYVSYGEEIKTLKVAKN
jgi:hypothetical protein